MARSADDVTVSTSVAESSVGSVSAIGLNVMEAVFATVADAYPGGMKSVSWYETEPNGAIGADVVHVNVPAAIDAVRARDVEPTVPAGMGSDTTTPGSAVDGPPFVSVIVYVVEVPAATEATPSVFVTTMSTAGSTIVDSASELLPGTGSGVVEVTVAVSV